MSSLEIANSVRRVEQTFHGNYKPFPILEEGRPVGSISEDHQKIYITFRGSINSLWEILTCLDIRKSPLTVLGLKGRAHKGIFTAFNKVHKVILEKIHQCSQDKEIIVEGYSRGAGIATLVGLYLHSFFPNRKISVLNYSPMRIFDAAAVEAIALQSLTICNFTCEEDFVTKWPPATLGFYPCKTLIPFSANSLPFYKERVQKRIYSYLIGGIIGKIIKWILPASFWEAHMLGTYIEGAPKYWPGAASARL